MDAVKIMKKWEEAKGKMSIKDIEDKHVKQNLAILLENQERKDLHGQEVISEASQGAINTGTLGGFNNGAADPQSYVFRPIALALVRRTFPDLFANKVVGVQAMSTPIGLAYALRVIYDDGNGVEAAWDNVDYYGGYSGSQVGTSGSLAGAGANTSANNGVLDTSGAGASTSAAEKWTLDNLCNASVESAVAGCGDWPQLKMRIDQKAITAITRKLAASFSLEAAQDIKAMHGIEIEREMVNFLQYEITAELDREILYNLKSAAVDTANGGAVISAIDLTGNGTGIDGRWAGEKYMNIISSIIHQANIIATKTRRGSGNFVVVSPAIASALQAAGHQFVQYSSNVNPSTVMASIGKLNGQLEVYRDQYARADYALVGYKGAGINDAGIIFSPYIMGLTNRAISPADFTPRVGAMARYAITSNLLGAGRYYRLIPFYNVNKIIPGA
jgi:hypothetical protein